MVTFPVTTRLAVLLLLKALSTKRVVAVVVLPMALSALLMLPKGQAQLPFPLLAPDLTQYLLVGSGHSVTEATQRPFAEQCGRAAGQSGAGSALPGQHSLSVHEPEQQRSPTGQVDCPVPVHAPDTQIPVAVLQIGV